MDNSFFGSVRLALTGAFAFAMAVAHGAAVARIGETEYDSLVTAITESAADDVIELLADVSESFSDGSMTTKAPIEHNLTITSAGGMRREIYAENTIGYTFNVTNGTLTLSNVVLRSALRTQSASYDMYLHAKGKTSKVVFGEDFLMSGITNSGGNAHAVCYWESSATLDMKPGAEVRFLNANYGHLRFSSSTFNFSGGIISDCYTRQGEGCPVYLYGSGKLNMTGGVITRCGCERANVCASVFLHSDGGSEANVSGGAITNNAVIGILSNVASTSKKTAAINLSGDAVISDNVRGDIAFRLDDALRLTGDFTGYATVTNLSVSGMPELGTKAGLNTDWWCGACNLRVRGDDSYQLLNDNGGNLVWGTIPVRVGDAYYRTMYEAMAAAPDTATFEILCDNPEFKDPVVKTNLNWRFEGVGGQKTLTWPSAYFSFYFKNCNITLSDAVLTAAQRVTTKSSVSTASNQHFINMGGGSFTLESGGGITNVYTGSHAVLAIGHDGMTGGTVASTLLFLKPGSILAGLSSNYGPIRFEGSGARFVMEGGTVSGCTSRLSEGAPFCFQDSIHMTMTGGMVTMNTCNSAKSATMWCNYNTTAYDYLFNIELLGGEISGNSNGAAVMVNSERNTGGSTHVTLGGSMCVGDPGLCIYRMPAGGGLLVSADDDYSGTCSLFVTNGLLASPAETFVLGDIPSSVLSHFTWSNAADYPDYRFASISGLAAFVPAGVPDSEAFGDNSVWSAVTGFGTDLVAVLSSFYSGNIVYLIKDITLEEPVGSNDSKYILDGLGHEITCISTNFLRTIRKAVTWKNVAVTGNRGRNTVGNGGMLTLGDGFVFSDFAAAHKWSYASFVAENGGLITIEDGAVIENGLSQVGVLRVEGAASRIVMNGGVVRNIRYDSTSMYSYEGAAVNILGGTFEMNGGVISNCLWDATAAAPQFSGAVYFNADDTTFRMTGGRIVENTAGVWCAKNADIEVEGSATIATNAVRDLYVTVAGVIRQTGDFAGDVAVTSPFDGLGTAFGLWEAGGGAEHFRHGRKFGKAENGQLIWDMNHKGIVFVVH